MNRRAPRPLTVAALALAGLATLVVSGSAWANKGGRAFSSGKGGSDCSSCHTGGIKPTVAIDGPKALDAGVTGSYTFRIMTNAAITGMNAAATDGWVLQGDTNGATKTSVDEVVHAETLKPNPDGGAAVYTFKFTPEYGGKVTLYAAGNACDGDDGRDGDNAQATTFEVDVNGPPLPVKPVPDASTTPGTGKPGTDGGQTDGGASSGSSAAPVEEEGCAVASANTGSVPLGAGATAALTALALVLMVSRRRRS